MYCNTLPKSKKTWPEPVIQGHRKNRYISGGVQHPRRGELLNRMR